MTVTNLKILEPILTLEISNAEYITDDRDYPLEDQRKLVIFMGGNGDWYVQVAPVGGVSFEGVRLCTSGGASTKVPGLTNAIAEAYRCIKAADSASDRRSLMSESYSDLKAEVEVWRATFPDKEFNLIFGIQDKIQD